MLIATSSPQHFLVIRRLIACSDDLTFYPRWAPEGTPAAMTFFHHHRRPQMSDQTNVQDREGHTRLRTSVRPAPGTPSADTLPWPPRRGCGRQGSATTYAATSPSRTPPASVGRRNGDGTSDADLRIPLGATPVPSRNGQPCRPGIAATARIERLATQRAAGLTTRARLAFGPRLVPVAAPPPNPRPGGTTGSRPQQSPDPERPERGDPKLSAAVNLSFIPEVRQGIFGCRLFHTLRCELQNSHILIIGRRAAIDG